MAKRNHINQIQRAIMGHLSTKCALGMSSWRYLNAKAIGMQNTHWVMMHSFINARYMTRKLARLWVLSKPRLRCLRRRAMLIAKQLRARPVPLRMKGLVPRSHWANNSLTKSKRPHHCSIACKSQKRNTGRVKSRIVHRFANHKLSKRITTIPDHVIQVRRSTYK